MMRVLKQHWPEYLREALGLGLVMVSICLFTILLEHPSFPFHDAVPDLFMRRMLRGLAMGCIIVGIIYSPWGKQSGAHLNPAVTLTFFRLGKMSPSDAFGYAGAQFLGGVAGVQVVTVLLMPYVAHPSVNYAITVPGPSGSGLAFVAELVISFGLMLVVLTASNTPQVARFTGLFVGALLAAYTMMEAPFSGMSMNPARTVASAVHAQVWTSIWIYFAAPVLGMLAAAEVFLQVRRGDMPACPKLHHDNAMRCIFCGKPAEGTL